MVCLICSRRVAVEPKRFGGNFARPVPPACHECGAIVYGNDTAELIRFVHRLANCGISIDDRGLLQS